MSKNKNDNLTAPAERIHLGAWIVCLLSAVGIYLAISNHNIAFAVLALNIASLIFFNCNEIFCVTFFLMPFAMVYKYDPAATSLFTYFSFAAIIVLLFKRNFKMSGRKMTLVWLLLFTVYLFADINGDYKDCLKILSSFLMAFLFVQTVNKDNFPTIVTFLSVGCLISSFIGLRKGSWSILASYYDDLNIEYLNGVRTIRFSALYEDPNYFSILVLLCLFALLVFAFLKKIKFITSAVLAVPLFIFGCMTYSKLYYIGIAILAAMFMFIVLKNSKYKIWAVLISIFLIAAVLFIALNYGFIDSVADRFEEDDISNGRLDIWSRYLSYILSSVKTLLFGDGIGAAPYDSVGAHNSYIEALYHLGLFGSSIYLLLIASILNTKKHLKKRTLLNYSPLVLFLLAIATLGTLFSHDFIYLIIIIWIVMNTDLSEMNSGSFEKNEHKRF